MERIQQQQRGAGLTVAAPAGHGTGRYCVCMCVCMCVWWHLYSRTDAAHTTRYTVRVNSMQRHAEQVAAVTTHGGLCAVHTNTGKRRRTLAKGAALHTPRAGSTRRGAAAAHIRHTHHSTAQRRSGEGASATAHIRPHCCCTDGGTAAAPGPSEQKDDRRQRYTRRHTHTLTQLHTHTHLHTTTRPNGCVQHQQQHVTILAGTAEEKVAWRRAETVTRTAEAVLQTQQVPFTPKFR